MADRYPLVANPDSKQIQELGSFDNLNLTNSGIVGATTITSNQFIGDLVGKGDVPICEGGMIGVIDGIGDIPVPGGRTLRDLVGKGDDPICDGGMIVVIEASPFISVHVSYTLLRAHEPVLELVCRLMLEKKNIKKMSKKVCSNSKHDESKPN